MLRLLTQRSSVDNPAMLELIWLQLPLLSPGLLQFENLGSIPKSEHSKAAGMQSSRSWHGEVVTRNIDGVRRAGRHLWSRPVCFLGCDQVGSRTGYGYGYGIQKILEK